MLYIVLRADGDFGPDFCFSGLEGDLEVELVVDGCLLGGPGVADDVAQVAEGGDEGADVVFAEPAAGLGADLAGVAGERRGALGFYLAGPPGDGLGVGSGVEGGLVAGQPGVAVGHDGEGVFVGLGGYGGGGLCCFHLADGLGEPVRREDDGEPAVDGGQDIGLAEVDVGGVADRAGESVFLRVPAPVIGSTVVV